MPEFTDPNLILFGKLALAAFLGILIGTERAVVGKRAGTRTFGLVSLGACLFVIVSIQATSQYLGLVNFDPMRVAAAVVSGIGFLGAGLIIFRGDSLRGLTTAAGLWVSAGVGIAVAVGMYAVAIFSTVLTLVIFTVFWFVEDWFKRWFNNNQPVVIDMEDDNDEDGEDLRA
jgi:putative Mg2+ transporter-C (MgtC) family protein